MRNMASENHFLLTFFTSKNPKWVLIKILPLLGFYACIIVNKQFEWHFLGVFFLGVVAWSLFEYLVHRFAYHKRSKFQKLQWYLDAFHLHHHQHLQDYRVLNAGVMLIYPLTVIILSMVYLLVANLVFSVWFGLGMTCYYLFYEYIHYQIHLKIHTSGYLKNIQQYHLYHHYKNWNKNFGNTLTLWDKIFNTYDKNYRQMNVNSKQYDDFITSNLMKE